MDSIATAEILDFQQRFGERYPHSARLFENELTPCLVALGCIEE